MTERLASKYWGKKTLVTAGAACVGASIVYGCSLGLDSSKIGAANGDASIPPASEASPDDDAQQNAPDASLSDAEAGAPGCVLNTDCTGSNGCLVGTCDAGTCSFAICPTSACQGSTCSAATSTCSSPTTYGFHSAEVNVTAGAVGCGGNPSLCLAAAYPFVFVGTTTGVVGYVVSDPSNPTPPTVTVAGLAFLPTFITAIGSRVFFVGYPQGAGPTYTLAIAWIDVPNDPLKTTLQANAVLEVVSVTGLSNAWAATDGSLFLSDNDGTGTFPTANVVPPLMSGATITFFSSPGIPAGASPVIPSGSRLVVAEWPGTTPYQNTFSFETGAGTQAAQNSGAQQTTFADIGGTGPQSAYAQGSDGSNVWNAQTAFLDDAGGIDIGSVRVAWLVASGSATQFAPTQFVTVEQYTPPVAYGTPVLGPVAWVDTSTALVLATAAASLITGSSPQTSVQVAVSTPSPVLASGRRYVLTQSVGQVGAAASGGYGYVLAAGAAGATTCTLHIFAPSCAAAP